MFDPNKFLAEPASAEPTTGLTETERYSGPKRLPADRTALVESAPKGLQESDDKWSPYRYESKNPKWWEKLAIAGSALAGRELSYVPGARKLVGNVAGRFIQPLGYAQDETTKRLWDARPEGERLARKILFAANFGIMPSGEALKAAGLKRTGKSSFAVDTTTHAGYRHAANLQSLLNSYYEENYPGLGRHYRDKWDFSLNKDPNDNTVPALKNRAGRAFLSGLTLPVTVEGYLKEGMLAPDPSVKRRTR